MKLAQMSWKMLSFEDALASLEAGTLPLLAVEDFACILQKCRKEKNPVHVSCLHAYMSKNGLDTCAPLGTDLISMLVEVGRVDDARNVFDKLVHPYQCSWNCLVAGYVKHGNAQAAFCLYEKMRLDNSLRLSGPAVVALLKACTKLNDLAKGSQIHGDIANGVLLKKDMFVGSALV
eukprot:c9981_g1_i1 orf=84-611(+)